MGESVLRDKSKQYAIEIVNTCRRLKSQHVEMPLIDQLLRSGTSVGANIYEARYAQSKKDFISKLQIALKECNESEYWLSLLSETKSIPKDDYECLNKLCWELRRMLIASLTTSKTDG